MNRVVPQLFMLLKREEREHLSKVFNLPKTGVAEIKDQELVSDGHTMEDLGHITAERMAEYVGSNDTFARLWELTLAKVHSELNPPVGVIGTVQIETDPETNIELNKEVKKKGK